MSYENHAPSATVRHATREAAAILQVSHRISEEFEKERLVKTARAAG